ncbi:MAG: TetR/AcrR family transcriptional regulator [Solirubrobacteraceae bacterium]
MARPTDTNLVATRAARPDGRGSPRGKRVAILTSAVEYFGQQGYEDTKWADVAAAVGIGSTALYHYFESKLHCLYVIMTDALESSQREFERIIDEDDDYLETLLALLRSGYELSEHEVLRFRVLVAEQGLVGVRRSSPREEEARELARARTRDLEFAWAAFLVRGMEQVHLPEVDPRLLARAVLGLNLSLWHWYRPRGTMSLEQIADFFVRRQLTVLGLSPALADDTPPAIERAQAGTGSR